jgi:hypothetical protein
MLATTVCIYLMDLDSFHINDKPVEIRAHKVMSIMGWNIAIQMNIQGHAVVSNNGHRQVLKHHTNKAKSPNISHGTLSNSTTCND